MSGTPAGGLRASKIIREKYGVTEDGKSKMHVRVGALGGKVKGVKKGFAAKGANPSLAGAKGGNRTKADYKPK